MLSSRSQLAHLALLYDLHLHDLHPEQQYANPSLDKMRELFETFVAAVALDLGVSPGCFWCAPLAGIPYTLSWLQDLVNPWVVECIAIHNATIPAKDLKRYQELVHEHPE
jgi:hypothetical protein